MLSLADRQREFWELVRKCGNAEAQLTFGRTPRAQHWYDISIGVSGVEIELTLNSLSKVVAVGLYIEENKPLFGRLFEQRESIETALGFPLDWRPLPEKKASRILREREGDFTDAAQAHELAEWLVTTAGAFAGVFSKHVQPASGT